MKRHKRASCQTSPPQKYGNHKFPFPPTSHQRYILKKWTLTRRTKRRTTSAASEWSKAKETPERRTFPAYPVKVVAKGTPEHLAILKQLSAAAVARRDIWHAFVVQTFKLPNHLLIDGHSRRQQSLVGTDSLSSAEIDCLRWPSANKIYLTIPIEDAPCRMEVDTGSSKSLIS